MSWAWVSPSGAVCWWGVESLAALRLARHGAGMVGNTCHLPCPCPHHRWASGSRSSWPLSMAQRELWKGASGDRQQGGRWQAGLYKGALRLHFLWARALVPAPGGGCTNLPAQAPGCLPAWLVHQPASPSGYCLPPGAGIRALSPAAWTVSPSPQGWRGAGRTPGPALPSLEGHCSFLILLLILAPNKTG